MICKCYIAVAASHSIAAFPAQDECRMAPPVKKQDDLTSILEVTGHCSPQCVAEDRPVALCLLFSHVNYVNSRHLMPAHSHRQFMSLNQTLLGPIVCLQARRCRTKH